MHPELERRGTFAHLKLGRLPGRPADALQLGRYIDQATLPPAPSSVDYAAKVADWPMYGNNEIGDCTCAAVGHMIETWTANAGTPRVPDEDAILQLYIPDTGSEDTGRVEQDVLTYWRNTGVGGDRIAGFAAVRPLNTLHVKTAAYLFGGLYIGIALPLSAQTQHMWDLVDGPNAEPGSWGGHAVDVVGYDQAGLTIVTWGATLRMTWAFWRAYVEECYAVASTDWLDSQGISPQGVNLRQLLADLEEVC